MKKHISAVLENIHIPQNSAENTTLEFPLTFLEVWIFSGTVSNPWLKMIGLLLLQK